MALVLSVFTPADNAPLQLVLRSTAMSVGQLKALIMREHPLHPAPAAQRLIFAGKELRDADALAAVLAPVVTLHGRAAASIHLVVTPDTGAGTAPASAVPASPRLPVVLLNGRPYLIAPLLHGAALPTPAAGTPTWEQLLAASATANTAPAHDDPPADPAAAADADAAPAPAPAPAEAAPAAAAEAAPAAGGLDDGAPQPLGLIDVLAMLARLAFMVFVFAQGGGWMRMSVLITAAVAIFIVQLAMRLPAPQRRRPRNPPPQQQPQAQQPAALAADATPAPDEPAGPWKDLLDVVVPFFTSLLPVTDFAPLPAVNVPPVLANNNGAAGVNANANANAGAAANANANADPAGAANAAHRAQNDAGREEIEGLAVAPL